MRARLSGEWMALSKRPAAPVSIRDGRLASGF
jgi:hypothetical protein